MKLDPNLEKIRDANMHEIIRGNINPVLLQGKDYLYNILGPSNFVQAEAEMDVFAKHIKQIVRDYRRQKAQQRKARKQRT